MSRCAVYRLKPAFKEERKHSLHYLLDHELRPDVDRYDRIRTIELGPGTHDELETYRNKVVPLLEDADIRDAKGIVLMITDDKEESACFFMQRDESGLHGVELPDFYHGEEDVIRHGTRGFHIPHQRGTWSADEAKIYGDTLFWLMMPEDEPETKTKLPGEAEDEMEPRPPAVVDGRGRFYGFFRNGFNDHTREQVLKKKKEYEEKDERLKKYSEVTVTMKEKEKKKAKDYPSSAGGREYTGRRASIRALLQEKRQILEEA